MPQFVTLCFLFVHIENPTKVILIGDFGRQFTPQKGVGHYLLVLKNQQEVARFHQKMEQGDVPANLQYTSQPQGYSSVGTLPNYD